MSHKRKRYFMNVNNEGWFPSGIVGRERETHFLFTLCTKGEITTDRMVYRSFSVIFGPYKFPIDFERQGLKMGVK